MSEQSQPNYYANIPADVRYAPIKANAKLLYAEITALCNKEGYCWASNSYFAKLYQVRPQSISDWVSELVRGGFVRIEVDQARGNLRKIFLAGDLLRKNVIPITEKRTHNTKKNITKNINTVTSNDVTNVFNKLREHLKLSDQYKLSDQRKVLIKRRLKDFTPEQIVKAGENLSRSEYHMGDNPQRKKYASVDFLLRSYEKTEEWLLAGEEQATDVLSEAQINEIVERQKASVVYAEDSR